MFQGGGGGALPATQPQVKEEDPAVQKASAEAAKRRRTARGFRSTIMGSRMIDDNAPALKETFGA